MKSLGRILTAMVTPFAADGSVDINEACRIAEHLIENGHDGVVVSGTTGESPALETHEKLELFAAIKRRLGNSGTVVAGTGGNNTQHSVELTKRAVETGVDAVLAVVPYYNKPTQDGLLEHFGAIAQAADIPVIMYNIPGRTGVNMLPETTHELARRHRNIVGQKESTGNVEQHAQLVSGNPRPDEFSLWSGDDYFYLPALALGGYGIISVAGHVVGRRIRAMTDAFDHGNMAAAGAIHRELQPLFTALFTITSPIPIKWAVNRLGFAAGPCRSPLGAMPESLARTLEPLIAPYLRVPA
ncbi:MAG: 4-hydroxy-tetrahydrodipicolinate synthase [Candidatus Velthaea sp.]|jgi:4-hydroxy-tetrahydrodipicolinate synthase